MTPIRAILALFLVFSALPALAGPIQGPFPPFANGINVKLSGAKCDGATDDYAAISAAASKAASGSVKAVYFPPSGTACLVSQFVTIPSGVSFVAQPGTATLKPTTGNVSSPELLAFANGAVGSSIFGLIIDGGGADHANTSNVVQAFGATGVVIDHATFQHTHGIAALFSTNIVDSGVRDSIFSDVGNHWKTTLVTTDRQQAIAFCCGTTANNHGNFATGNYFSDIGLDAISVGAQTNFLASRNRCEIANNQVALLTATAYAACIYGTSDTEITVTDNVVSGASGNGIDVNSTTAILISGNHVTTSGAAGISVATTTNAAISGNEVLNNVQWASSVQKGGISLGGANGAVTLSGNLSTDNQGSKTQTYGIHGFTYQSAAASFTDLRLDPSNVLTGNATSDFGGAIADYTLGGTRDNRILNPCFSIDQRSAGGTYTAGGGNKKIVDQWIAGQSANSFSEARSVATNFKGCGNYGLHIIVTTSHSAAIGDLNLISQSIEGKDLQDLNWGTANAAPLSLEFCAKTSIAGTYTSSLRVVGPAIVYVIPYTITANTMTCFYFVIPGYTVATIPISNYQFILTFDFGSGTNFQTATANAWIAGTFYNTSAITPFVSQTNGATFDLSSVRLYPGAMHLPWIQRPYGEELERLKRYYRTSFADGTAPVQNGGTVGAATIIAPFAQATSTAAGAYVGFGGTMRTTPAMTFYSTSAATANCYDITRAADAGAAAAANTGDSGFFLQCTLAAGDLIGDVLRVHYAADAE